MKKKISRLIKKRTTLINRIIDLEVDYLDDNLTHMEFVESVSPIVQSIRKIENKILNLEYNQVCDQCKENRLIDHKSLFNPIRTFKGSISMTTSRFWGKLFGSWIPCDIGGGHDKIRNYKYYKKT